MNPQENDQHPAGHTHPYTPGGPTQQPYMQGQQPAPVAQSMTVQEHQIDPEVVKLHEESKTRFPHLHLSPDEYVIAEVKRHIIGVISIWAIVILIVGMTFLLMPVYAANHAVVAATFGVEESALPSAAILTVPLLIINAFFILGAVIATIVYWGNRFYITNQSVIQMIQTSLFSTNEQTVNLRNIEDVSHRQEGILQQILNYGSIRLSTEGDETTYRFNYVTSPKKHTAIMVDAMEHAMGIGARWRKRPPGTPNQLD